MDKYEQHSKEIRKRRNQRRMILICACSIMLGYVLGNLSCLMLVVYFGR